ncbi:hypothetical protein ABT340_05800 [Streptosporangium sp. NPDC000239]
MPVSWRPGMMIAVSGSGVIRVFPRRTPVTPGAPVISGIPVKPG